WVLHLSFSLHIGTTGSHVPPKSLIQVHATFMPDVQPQGTAGLSPGYGSGFAEDWMNTDNAMIEQGLLHRTRQGAPAPTSNLGPILAGAPCLGYPGKEGYIKNCLTARK
ncbi:MAG: hypothetical protein KKD99_13185, partial [Proteobacteria bacterium]|nr:hypothetical protein [Pseudomonadota bacterium]